MEIHEVSLRVRYAETDQMGVVYHSNYLVWMEVGRIEWCRARGVSYRDLEQQEGVLLAVVEANCRYNSPARYDDEVTVRTWVGEASSRMVRFEYEIRRDGRTLASGFTKHAFLDRNLRPARLPPRYHELFGVSSARAQPAREL